MKVEDNIVAKLKSEIILKIICMIILVVIINILIVFLLRINTYKYLMKVNPLNSDIVANYIFHNSIINGNDNSVGETVVLKDIMPLSSELYNTIENNISKDKYIKGTLKNKIITWLYYNNIFDKSIKKYILNNSRYIKQIQTIKKDVYNRCRYYPILIEKDSDFSYENTWQSKRSYGGNRKHEGTDIMYKKNRPDEVPIISVCDGIVVKKGWLELGGYRLYIKSGDNLYLYYAHLSSYEPGIDEGDVIYAGQVIGYMGSTGYGKEGTDNKFDVHLHMGVYYKLSKSNMSNSSDGIRELPLNPYYLLQFLENNKLYYQN
ncbi:MAG: M23 family metallopeptidase [Lachnospiraceae bacterium]|nr:M23 family metallopeptidase [Lachnospiraceae bacterium]